MAPPAVIPSNSGRFQEQNPLSSFLTNPSSSADDLPQRIFSALNASDKIHLPNCFTSIAGVVESPNPWPDGPSRDLSPHAKPKPDCCHQLGFANNQPADMPALHIPAKARTAKPMPPTLGGVDCLRWQLPSYREQQLPPLPSFAPHEAFLLALHQAQLAAAPLRSLGIRP